MRISQRWYPYSVAMKPFMSRSQRRLARIETFERFKDFFGPPSDLIPLAVVAVGRLHHPYSGALNE